MSKKIDLKNLKTGDTVEFRCGGFAAVQSIEKCKTDERKRLWIIFEGCPTSECAYLFDGKGGYDGTIAIFDIVDFKQSIRSNT